MTDVTEAAETPASPPGVAADATPADWKAGLSEELQRDPSIAHIADVPNLAQSYINAQRMVGADKIAVPGQHATDEELNQVYDKLGRPETPDGYELEMNNIPEGLSANPDLVGWFQNTAHKVGLTPRQAQQLSDEYNTMAGVAEQSPDQRQAEASAKEENGIRELQREYGKAFDHKISIAKSVMNEYGGRGLLELTLADGRPLGSHPDLVRTFANIGGFMQKKLGEDSVRTPKSDGAITPGDAEKELAKIQVPGGAYWDAKHPGHALAVAEALRLREFVAVDPA